MKQTNSIDGERDMLNYNNLIEPQNIEERLYNSTAKYI